MKKQDITIISIAVLVAVLLFGVAVWRSGNKQKKLISGSASKRDAAGCSKSLADVGFIEINAEAVKKIAIGADQIEVAVKDPSCYPSGKKVEIVGEPERTLGIRPHRGLGKISRSTDKSVTVLVERGRLGGLTVLAMNCFEFCDEVVRFIPAPEELKSTVLIDTRAFRKMLEPNQKPDDVASTLKVPLRRGTMPTDADFAKVGSIKGRTFLVYTDMPYWQQYPILFFMRGLKERGADSVKWLATGIQNFRAKKSLAPPDLPGVKSILPYEVAALRQRGAQLVFMSNTFDRLSTPIPGSISVSIRARSSNPSRGRPVEEANLSSDQNFSLSPGSSVLDLNKPVIVYGATWIDWSAYYYLENLKSKRAPQLYWLRDGIAGYLEANQIGAMTGATKAQ